MRLAERDTDAVEVLEAPSSGRYGSRVFDSFKDPEFGWFYAAMLGQMAALNMQLVVRGLLAYDLTNSYAALGLIGLAGGLPMLVLSLVGGVLADAMPKKVVVQLGQVFSLLNAAGLAVLVMVHLISMEWLVASAALQGVIMALMMPGRQAMIPEVVGMERLNNAIALNVAGMNGMRLLAPAVGGFIVSFLGYSWAFWAMALLYVVAIVTLQPIRWQPASAPGEAGASVREIGVKALVDIKEGVAYARRTQLIFMLLAVSFVSSIFGMPYLYLLPGYVKDIFGGGGSETGLLISISAVGSLVATIWLAALPDRSRGLLMLVGMVILGASIAGFALTKSYWIGAAIMIPVGVGSALRQTLSQGLIQAYVDNVYRGRVMAVYMTQFSIMQMATFFLGMAAQLVGVRVSFVALGVALVAVTMLVWMFEPRMRRLD